MKEYILDPKSGLFLWVCPVCKVTISFLYESAVRISVVKGRCQGCRARETFARNPGLIGMFMGFWEKYGYPQSASWAADLSTM